MIDGQLITMQTYTFPLELWFQNIAYCDGNDVSIVYTKKWQYYDYMTMEMIDKRVATKNSNLNT